MDSQWYICLIFLAGERTLKPEVTINESTVFTFNYNLFLNLEGQ